MRESSLIAPSTENLQLHQCQYAVLREGNVLAHSLARRAVLTADTDVWVEELPSDLDDVFQNDL